MALDQVKTQVLILHNEQSTLDNLSAGIDDRYTVHCATTGTEALNTLGDTPIHVIVSAQDLPGMSGVEALREAKKRSPETIGILLAGNSDEGLEALVGAKEIFKIVRGGISSDDLSKLIDNATQQMRLLALAESANDTAAAPDNLGAEHIVMETSENGSTIISDGTASLPQLDAQKISANKASGADAVEVLILSKDEEFVETIRESSRGMHNVRCATTLAQAEEALSKFKIGVAVVDAAVVGAKVEKLTVHLRNRKHRLVSIVAGRRDDGEMLMDLINRGRVYRFLLKPVSPGRARLAVEASVKHHLEAPDAAFKMAPSTTAGAAPAARPAPRPKPAVKSEPAATPTAKPEPKPSNVAPQPISKPTSAPEPMQVSIDDGLSTPFDGADTGFVETMTGLVGKVGRSFGSGDDKDFERTVVADETTEDAVANSGDFGDTGDSIVSKPTLVLAAGIVMALIGAGIWMFTGGDAPTQVTPSPVVNTVNNDSTDAEPPVAAPVETLSARDLLDEARLARDAGQIIYPAGSSAIELYTQALAADPDDATVTTELSQVIDQAFAMAESAMLENRFGDAETALRRVRAADADHPRLAFISAQLEQIQLRSQLDAARAAIRDARFEDAAAALSAAMSLRPSDSREIDAVADELASARSAEQVDDVLLQAADRLGQGMLVDPANDNARYFYELVLSNDPGNTSARQGLVVVASKLVLQARTEIDQGQFDEAERLLNDAREMDPDSIELQAATVAINEARQRIVSDQRRQREARDAAARVKADRLAALQQAEEQRRALAAAAIDKSASEPVAKAVVDDKSAAPADVGAAKPSDVETPVERPANIPVAANQDAEFVASSSAETVAGPTRGVSAPPVAVSSLTRTKYVAPKYPRSAERRSLSGWVDVVFVVTFDGTTKDIEVLGSEPGDVFVSAATRAVERWEFEPVIEGGTLVEKRAGVRMMFAFE